MHDPKWRERKEEALCTFRPNKGKKMKEVTTVISFVDKMDRDVVNRRDVRNSFSRNKAEVFSADDRSMKSGPIPSFCGLKSYNDIRVR